jgi:hypothetical protein
LAVPQCHDHDLVTRTVVIEANKAAEIWMASEHLADAIESLGQPQKLVGVDMETEDPGSGHGMPIDRIGPPQGRTTLKSMVRRLPEGIELSERGQVGALGSTEIGKLDTDSRSSLPFGPGVSDLPPQVHGDKDVATFGRVITRIVQFESSSRRRDVNDSTITPAAFRAAFDHVCPGPVGKLARKEPLQLVFHVDSLPAERIALPM